MWRMKDKRRSAKESKMEEKRKDETENRQLVPLLHKTLFIAA